MKTHAIANTPKHPQNEEAVELIQRLKDRLRCDTDQELADKLRIPRNVISDMRRRGLSKIVAGIIRALA